MKQDTKEVLVIFFTLCGGAAGILAAPFAGIAVVLVLIKWILL